MKKKHELGIESLQPGGAKMGGKPKTWKDIKNCIPIRPKGLERSKTKEVASILLLCTYLYIIIPLIDEN